MIALALLMLQVTAPAPDTADDVVVIGRRLEQSWSAAFSIGKKGMRCQVRRSTGDVEIDEIGCLAMRACMPTFQSRIAATDDRAIRPDVKKMMRTSLNAELATCVKRERQAGITALLARRKGA